jgi:hypothetical protein
MREPQDQERQEMQEVLSPGGEGGHMEKHKAQAGQEEAVKAKSRCKQCGYEYYIRPDEAGADNGFCSENCQIFWDAAERSIQMSEVNRE